MSGGSKKSVPDIPTERTFLGDPIAYYRQATGAYPSNAQIWWAYRRPIEVGTDSPPKSYLEVFDPSLRHQISLGNTPSPKGHYVLNAFQQDRSSVSAIPNLAVQSSRGRRPMAVGFYAGRVFYGGVNTAEYNTKIYFTQMLERPEQVQMCYQAFDPTSEDVRDLLPTDGGVIVIPEITEVYHMHTMGQSLYVFAKNGVWQVSGSEGIGFRANDYSVVKVSGVATLSGTSFVDVEGAPIWWNRTGIYTMTADQIGSATVQSLTEETIKDFFDLIPAGSKLYAKGAYNPIMQRVQWLYSSTDPEQTGSVSTYDRILNLDTRTGAFFPYSVPSDGRVQIKGIFDVEGYSTSQVFEEVFVGVDEVLVVSEPVIISVFQKTPVQSKLKYVVNVLDDTTGVPPPPPAPEPTIDEVFVSDDIVLVDADEVYVVNL